MSNYTRTTIHPETKKPEEAMWLDDYFGSHKYGVKFPNDKKVYKPDEVTTKTEVDKVVKKVIDEYGETLKMFAENKEPKIFKTIFILLCIIVGMFLTLIGFGVYLYIIY